MRWRSRITAPSRIGYGRRDGPDRPARHGTELAPFVACPETLGPLERADGGYWSPEAQRLYPERRGLVFMAYAARDEAMIQATMREEHEHQGTGDAAPSNLAFLRQERPPRRRPN
jgi:hypothetical protein